MTTGAFDAAPSAQWSNENMLKSAVSHSSRVLSSSSLQSRRCLPSASDPSQSSYGLSGLHMSTALRRSSDMVVLRLTCVFYGIHEGHFNWLLLLKSEPLVAMSSTFRAVYGLMDTYHQRNLDLVA